MTLWVVDSPENSTRKPGLERFARFDSALRYRTVCGSLAWAQALEKAGVLSPAESRQCAFSGVGR